MMKLFFLLKYIDIISDHGSSQISKWVTARRADFFSLTGTYETAILYSGYCIIDFNISLVTITIFMKSLLYKWSRPPGKLKCYGIFI